MASARRPHDRGAALASLPVSFSPGKLLKVQCPGWQLRPGLQPRHHWGDSNPMWKAPWLTSALSTHAGNILVPSAGCWGSSQAQLPGVRLTTQGQGPKAPGLRDPSPVSNRGGPVEWGLTPTETGGFWQTDLQACGMPRPGQLLSGGALCLQGPKVMGGGSSHQQVLEKGHRHRPGHAGQAQILE